MQRHYILPACLTTLLFLVMAVASAGAPSTVERGQNCAAKQRVYWARRRPQEWMRSTCLRKGDVALSQMIDWQGRGCLRTATMLGDRAELILVLMTSMTSCRAGEGTVEAYCEMQRKAARVEAREGLDSDGQLR